MTQREPLKVERVTSLLWLDRDIPLTYGLSWQVSFTLPVMTVNITERHVVEERTADIMDVSHFPLSVCSYS